MTLLLIDNHDSFTYNLYALIKNLGIDVLVVKNNELILSHIKTLSLMGVVISPGPLTPLHAGSSLAVIGMYAKQIPMLGVCLGHQAISLLFGGKVIRGEKPLHGKVTYTYHYSDKIFNSVPSCFNCMHYHSLIVDVESSKNLQVIARNENGVVMGIKHNHYDLYGLQFHPESILSTYGDVILANFINICSMKKN